MVVLTIKSFKNKMKRHEIRLNSSILNQIAYLSLYMTEGVCSEIHHFC